MKIKKYIYVHIILPFNNFQKTTGTASLIRHKCKNQGTVQQFNIKAESLANLLISTQTIPPPPLTPAPIFPSKQSTSSASVSSTSTTTTKTDTPMVTIVKQSSSRAESAVNIAEVDLINSQIQWLSQNLITTKILGDSQYLNFLQSLVNYGANHGKKAVSNFINRDNIINEAIPKKCAALQNNLMLELKDIEFSISFSTWKNFENEKYVTVFVYYFTHDFEYRNAILGTRKYDNENHVSEIVKDIIKPYRNSNKELKCVSEEFSSDFDTYPCMISRISKVVTTVMNSNDDNRMFFKKIFLKAHEILSLSLKSSFEDSTDDYKMNILYSLYQFMKDNEVQNIALIKKYMNLFGTLFAAISSLAETTESGVRCVTSNKVYLWCKKLLKFYSEYSCDDKIVNNIGTHILKQIKENFSNKIHELYQIAVFLNPNFKSLKFLTPIERSALLDIVKKNLENLMNEENTSKPPNKKQKIAINKSHLNDTFIEFMDITMESVDDQVNSEIQRYMGYKLDAPIEIVEFWGSNDSFPYLKKLAKNYLNLPSCTFHSHCCFLNDGNEFFQKCKNLQSDDIETLTFLHRNL